MTRVHPDRPETVVLPARPRHALQALVAAWAFAVLGACQGASQDSGGSKAARSLRNADARGESAPDTAHPAAVASADDSNAKASDNGGADTADQADGGAADDPNAKPEQLHVSFTGSKGDSVPANVWRQPGKRRRPAALLQYGLGGTKDSSQIRQFAERMALRGFVVMTMDVPGRGARVSSTGKFDSLQVVTDHALFRWYVADYGKAMDYLVKRADVDAKRVAYIGASWGAITGIPYAAGDKRVKAVVSVVGGGNFFGIVPLDLDPAKRVGEIAPRPIFLINATNDQVILKPFAEALQNAAGPNAKKLWLNTDHTLAGQPLEKLADQVVDFVKQSL